eukprot:CAMPEP_0201573500 /NCGR_PEP_ID=MMETSP0190_2-20130828/17401_1 /ASSEMBLY_ACC=CAM_ASM_000263 /TAXON_ID=37353 /ORGANISM="Rosalina sp." /LENGTH=128 /DNA_ID=CAMNT_0048000553 /DNA_START=102 /DNA_END=485 /DNA_ORIENTATION=+
MILCPYEPFGCNLRIRRRFLQQHLHDSQVRHSTLQTQSHDRIATEVEELRERYEDIDFDELRGLQEDAEELREIRNACEEIDFDELQGLQDAGEEIQGLQDDVVEIQGDVEDVNERTNALEEDNKRLW